jgi:hypothetical protein
VVLLVGELIGAVKLPLSISESEGCKLLSKVGNGGRNTGGELLLGLLLGLVPGAVTGLTKGAELGLPSWAPGA